MKALVFEAPGQATIADVPRPIPAADELLLRPQFVGLCGTDLELLSGAMPYFTEGSACYPIRPGHEISALVDRDSGTWRSGTAVVVDPVIGCGRCPACIAEAPTGCSERSELGVRGGIAGGAAEYVAVPERNVHPLPPGVSLRHAVLVEPGVTALHAIRRLETSVGQRALVIGPGTLGGIAAQLLRSRGLEVDMPVLHQDRAAFVQRIGARVTAVVKTSHYDITVEAAGTPDAIHTAIRGTIPKGRIAFTGIQAAPVDRVNINELVLKDLTIHGVINGTGLYGEMLKELALGSVDAEAFIAADFKLADASQALNRLADQSRTRPKVLLRL